MIGGGKAAAARPDDRIDLIVTEKAQTFIAQQSEKAPFFLYLAFNAPHVPINPAPEFRGKSEAGLYGDYIQELDYLVGLVLDTLEKHGFAKNTLVIFTSDNGGVLLRDALDAGHRCNGELLGQKTDAWEGGHRIPFIARWPGHLPPGMVRKQLFSQVDIMATLADAAHITMPRGASPDGTSEFAAFADPDETPSRRKETAFLGIKGFALREGDWLYMPRQGSGGKSAPGTKGTPWKKLGFTNSDIDSEGRIKPDAPPDQLYNLANDIGEAHNLTRDEPKRAAAMHARMDELNLRFTRLEEIGQVRKPEKSVAPEATVSPALSP